MTLTFTLKRQYGRERFYPEGPAAVAVVGLTGRKCLNETEIERLKWAGFRIEIKTEVSHEIAK